MLAAQEVTDCNWINWMKYLLMAMQTDKVGREDRFNLFTAASKASFVAVGRKICGLQCSIGEGLDRRFNYCRDRIGGFDIGKRWRLGGLLKDCDNVV